MQRNTDFREISDEEHIKKAGIILDIDEISRVGSLTPAEALILKWYGVYKSRATGDHMARIVIPGGKVTAGQAHAFASFSKKYSNGLVHATTRQALQLHQLKLAELAPLFRDLSKNELTTFHGCGDVTRIVTTCPEPENCGYRTFDVRPYAEDIQNRLGACRDLDDLPRKFKIAFSGCSADCAQPFMNCLGFTAVIKNEKGIDRRGFRVVIGGGMGWKAFVAQELFSFIPENRTFDVARAVAILFRDHGDRFDRTRSRLKFVVDRLGIDACREIVRAALVAENKSTTDLLTDIFASVEPMRPERPLTDAHLSTTDSVVRMRIPKAELPADHLAAFAELAELHADQHLYATHRQNIEFHGVLLGHEATLEKAVNDLGYHTKDHFGMRDIVCCVGTTYCPKAASHTRTLFDTLEAVTNDPAYANLVPYALINITGCPNSCSPYRVVDVGFRGMRISLADGGSIDGYQMLIGGDQRAHGQELGQFTAHDCPTVLRTVLDTFATLRTENETLHACVMRLGMSPFVKAVFA